MMTTAHAHTHARAHTQCTPYIYIATIILARSSSPSLLARVVPYFCGFGNFYYCFLFFPCAPVLWHIFPKFLAFKLLVHSVFFFRSFTAIIRTTYVRGARSSIAQGGEEE